MTDSGDADGTTGVLRATPRRIGLARLAATFGAERDRWVLWLPPAVALGIAAYFALPVEPPLWLGAMVLILAVGAAWFGRRAQAVLLVALGVGAVALGFAVSQLRTQSVAAPILERKYGPDWVAGQVLTIEPRVEDGSQGVRVVLRLQGLDGVQPGATPAKVRVRLTKRDPAAFAPGDWLRVRAVLRAPPGPAAPDAFDFGRRAFFQGIGAVGYAVGHAEALAPPVGADDATRSEILAAWRLAWASLRQHVATRVLAAVPGESGAVAAALMTGERNAIPADVIDAMRDSGLAHLLAISGLHIGLIAGLLFFTIRAALALVPRLALDHPIKKWAALAAGLGAFGYLMLVGATVPTQRAFIMLSLVLLAVILDRKAISLRLVAWAALAILLIAPESLLSASFQMSFGAVVALVAAYETLTAERPGLLVGRSVPTRIGFYLVGVALTSVIAILATAPFAMFHFNRVAGYGLAANMAAVPLTAFWIMPTALAGFCLMPFGLEALALVPMGWGIDLLLRVARTVAGWPGSVTPVPVMPTYGLALIVLGSLWLCLWRRRWRLWGLGGIVAGALSLAVTAPPDVLADSEGKLLAVRAPDGGMWLSTQRRARFSAGIWLRRASAAEGSTWPRSGTAAGGALTCDPLACLYRRDGRVVALVQDPRALAEDCRRADVVVSLEPVDRRACNQPTVLIDRFDLWAKGGHALWLDDGDITVRNVADTRGRRPWAPRRR